jgi:hypothetical protein
LTIELGDPDLEVNLLPDTLVWFVLAVVVLGLELSVEAVVAVVTGALLGLTGATSGAAAGIGLADSLRTAGMGAAVGVVTAAGVETTGAAGTTGVADGAVVVSVDVCAASLALFSFFILSISSSVLAEGRVGGGAGLDTGLGAGGGVSFFLGRSNSISLSLNTFNLESRVTVYLQIYVTKV